MEPFDPHACELEKYLLLREPAWWLRYPCLYVKLSGFDSRLRWLTQHPANADPEEQHVLLNVISLLPHGKPPLSPCSRHDLIHQQLLHLFWE